jgi:hypothetical protein
MEAHRDCLCKLALQESGYEINWQGDKTIRSNDTQEEVQGIETYDGGKLLIAILLQNSGKALCD